MSRSNDFAHVSLSDFKVGVTLRSPVYQDIGNRELLLLAAGTRITQSLLAKMIQRGVSQVRVCAAEWSRLSGETSGSRASGSSADQRRLQAAQRNASLQVQRQIGQRWGVSRDSFRHQLVQPKSSSYQPQVADRCAVTYQKSVTEVASMFQRVRNGTARRVEEIESVSTESLLRLADDLDLFVGMGLNPARDQYPYKHSLQTMMVAMSLGTVLGLPYQQLVELGIGCLLHDAGMLHIDKSLLSSRQISPLDFMQIKRHPVVAFDLLKKIPGVPHGVHMVVYQMHERCDGSGYPRGRSAGQIHPLAKIAAVADTFVAMVSPRPHRPALLPYHAMEHILFETRKGLFDPEVVRALLHTVSLFPIGSYVQLSDGQFGKVLRANDTDYMRPIVQICESPAIEPSVIDLSNQPGLRILRPLADTVLSKQPSRFDVLSPEEELAVDW